MAGRVSLSFDNCRNSRLIRSRSSTEQLVEERRTSRDTLLGDGKEGVRSSSGSDSVDSNLKVSIGTVLESDWH